MELEKFRADLLHDDEKEDETLVILSTSLYVLNKFTATLLRLNPSRFLYCSLTLYQ